MTPYKRVSNAIDTLRREINAAHPGRSKISDGTLGDTAHAARTSDHNPDANGIVHAMDVTVWDGPDPGTADDVAQPLAEFLRAKRDPRTKYVIHRGQMFSSYDSYKNGRVIRRAWQWGPYTGTNGHFHHVHVSVNGDDGAPWGYTGSPTATPAAWNPPPFPGTLTKTSSAPRVAVWRMVLGDLGYRGFKVGLYPWSMTLGAATRRFQRRHGLKPDGVVGPKTWAVAMRLLKKLKAKA